MKSNLPQAYKRLRKATVRAGKAHSTKKGKKGYVRKRDKKEIERQILKIPHPS